MNMNLGKYKYQFEVQRVKLIIKEGRKINRMENLIFQGEAIGIGIVIIGEVGNSFCCE